MHLISHRGYWVNENEKNKINAFHRAFKFGFGAEIDLREYKGELLVSHDLLCGEELNFDQILSIWDGESKLALNIKEDGLASIIQSKMKPYASENWFVFDMSIPDTFLYLNMGIKTYIRESEYENYPLLVSKSSGIWLDQMLENSYSQNWLIEKINLY